MVDLAVMQIHPTSEAEATAVSLALQFAMDHPDDVAFPWIDRKDGRLQLTSVNAAGTALVTDLADLIAVPSQNRLATRSFGEVTRIANEVTLLRGTGVPGEDLIYKVEPDWRDNRVIVTISELNDGLLKELASQFGQDAVAVRVNPDLPRVNSDDARNSDASPFGGGARINVPGGTCSSGFAWINGSQQGMITAAHCTPTGGAVSTPVHSMGNVTSGSGENWKPNDGTVPYTGQTSLRGDVALIWLGSTRSSHAFMFRGGPTSTTGNTVKSAWGRFSQSGDTVCVGGATRGELCGWTVYGVGIHVFYFNESAWARNMVEVLKSGRPCTAGGDSGGPVYTFVSGGVAAKGIHSGGAQKSVCSISSYFTDIQIDRRCREP